tara:strand:+ start:6530 stop:7654 length:1125 start_codon:yes stop_codon:yes gene_type:complete
MNDFNLLDLANYWTNKFFKNKNLDRHLSKIIKDEEYIKETFSKNTNLIDYHNFSLYLIKLQNKSFNSIYSQNIYKNGGALPRIKLYEIFFTNISKNNPKLNLIFLFNHLDGCPTHKIFENMKTLCFSGSVPDTDINDDLHCIPIIDTHHLISLSSKDYEFIYSPNSSILNIRNDYKFDNKINKIFWRGGSNKVMEPYKNIIIDNKVVDWGNLNMRYEIVKRYLKNKNMNIKITNTEENKNKYDNVYLDEHVNQITQMNYKYLLIIDGHASSYDGSIWKLRSSSLVIWIKNSDKQFFWTQWYNPLLKEYIHYIPACIENLDEVFNWCEDNPEKCKEIINNANTLIENILKKTLEYHNVLFNEINNYITPTNNYFI